jgi:hypothetical protein
MPEVHEIRHGVRLIRKGNLPLTAVTLTALLPLAMLRYREEGSEAEQGSQGTAHPDSRSRARPFFHRRRSLRWRTAAPVSFRRIRDSFEGSDSPRNHGRHYFKNCFRQGQRTYSIPSDGRRWRAPGSGILLPGHGRNQREALGRRRTENATGRLQRRPASKAIASFHSSVRSARPVASQCPPHRGHARCQPCLS